MAELTLGNVQVLLDRPTGEGAVLSCYADMSEAGYRTLWSKRLKNEIAAIEERLAGNHEARHRLAADVAAIQSALGTPAARRARGIAVFSATARGLFQAFALSIPMKDRLVLDEEPYLVPLLEALHRQRQYLVVLTDSHRGRLYAAGWGQTHLIGELDEPVARRQRSAGETWGKQQATIARNRENHLLRYRKELVRRIERAWTEAPFRGLILLGEHEALEHVRATLPSALAGRVIHESPHSWGSRREPGIDDVVRGVLDSALATHDERLASEVEQRLRAKSYAVVAGTQEVLDALRNGQVGYPGYVVLEPDRGQAATRCPGCGAVFASMPRVCTFCGAACDTVNLWQEILLFAARHDIPAHVVHSTPELTRHGGVAAMLSREGPWEPVAAGLRVERRTRP